ncbi:MAG: ADP-ribosylglycohydrolase family protein [Chitinophagaceae bacterium]|nr:ADP-ribosylglycohydrolase family protein [Chitinophagaceae bacterium]
MKQGEKYQLFLLIALLSVGLSLFAQTKNDSLFKVNKIKGLILGSCIGDALGGPIEFQGHPEIQASPGPPKLWTDTNDLINDAALKAAAGRLYLRSYKYVLPFAQPYGCWASNAPPGSVTDDSRHKFILLHMLRKAIQQQQFPVNNITLADAYLSWSKSKTIKTHPGYDTLCPQWLGESYKAINWLKGNREAGKAYPLERLWNGIPTCYGQMALTPLAALYPGQPEKAYLSAYNLAWFDNGFAKDMIAAINAGLAKALTLDPTKMTNEQLWTEVINTMKDTDPYDYKKIPWCERQVERWLNLADYYVKEANGSPAKLFALLDKEFMYTTKWEAQVPYTLIFCCLKICKYDPLAALQMSIEWGNDHDSYAQLLGAFVGAIYGIDIFPANMTVTVAERVKLDYNEDCNEWINLMQQLKKSGATKQLIKIK